MNYLYGWNSVSEFILDEFEDHGVHVKAVVIDDVFLSLIENPKKVNLIKSSEVTFALGDSVINCLGYKDLGQRIKIGEQLFAQGVLKSFISLKADVHKTASIDVGTVLIGNVVIERHSHIGRHGLFWGGSRVCHDSIVKDGVFMASGSIIGGSCAVGNMCSFGFNSSMRDKASMPPNTKVGANNFWRPVT